jgi:hypothetical protein
MATTNPTVTKSWVMLVPAAKNFILSAVEVVLEIAVTDINAAPTLETGHVISPYERESVSRVLIGPGYVWARIAPSQTQNATVVALTDWT